MIKVLYVMTAALVLSGGASAAERHRDLVGVTYGTGFVRGQEIGGSRISEHGVPTCYRPEYLAQRNASGACF